MICTVAEPQKKLPVFRSGKWSLSGTRKIFLYGHDAKTMKTFKLYFDSNDPCDTLDRAWFGEMWFPVQKTVCQVQSMANQASIPDPADLDMDYGCEEPDLCFSRSQVRDPSYALLDSGATHVLLPGHMLPKPLREHGHLKLQSIWLWARIKPSAGEMKSMHKKERILYFHWVD